MIYRYNEPQYRVYANGSLNKALGLRAMSGCLHVGELQPCLRVFWHDELVTDMRFCRSCPTIIQWHDDHPNPQDH